MIHTSIPIASGSRARSTTSVLLAAGLAVGPAVLLGASPSVWAAGTGVVAADFEAGGCPPTGWSRFGDSASLPTPCTTTERARSGARSLKVEDAATGTGANIGVTSASVSATPGTSYDVTAWFSGAAGVTARMYLDFLDAAGARVSAKDVAVQTTTAWQEGKLTAVAPAGASRVRVLLYSCSDCTGAFYVDDVGGGGVEPCPNRAPSAPTILGADGFGDGSNGWTGVSYTVRGARATDPDGDPVSYEFRSSDGHAVAGLEASVAFSRSGTKSLTLVATDDPTARCPTLAPAGATSAAYAFRVVDEWTVDLDAPADGSSCIAGTAVPAGAVVVLQCKAAASVNTFGVPANAIAAVTFTAGNWEKRDTSAPYSATFRTADTGLGFQELDACVTARNDKAAREFCSDAYAFFAV